VTDPPADVWLITGAQASGKSTVAELLARGFELAAHLRGYRFATSIVAGRADFDPEDPEWRRQLELRYRLSALVAAEYAAAGVTAVAQDNIYGPDVVTWIERAGAGPVHLVVLRPTVDVVEHRHEHRRQSTGKVAYRDGYTPAQNDADLATTPADLGLWLDTSDQTPEETVAAIRERTADARVR
jgi:chloramphenicol 3-O-phosphotransferase